MYEIGEPAMFLYLVRLAFFRPNTILIVRCVGRDLPNVSRLVVSRASPDDATFSHIRAKGVAIALCSLNVTG
jgi:hypothetical protein